MSVLRIGSLCTGYGGLDMAVRAVFGGELAWWSDIDPGPVKVMGYHHPGVPNLGDLTEVDWPATPDVDILTAGYPCQPFSNAGKRLGTEDPRHLWPRIADGIGVLRPRLVILENVAAHLRRGFGVVSADLAALGYRVAWGIVSAAEAGAPHLRKRLYVAAEDADRPVSGEWRLTAPGQEEGWGAWADPGRRGGVALADSASLGRGEGRPDDADGGGDAAAGAEVQDWLTWEPAIRRWEGVLGVAAPVATIPSARAKRGRTLNPALLEWMMGVPGRITLVPGLTRNERIKLAGNGVVAQQAVLAIRALLRNLEGE